MKSLKKKGWSYFKERLKEELPQSIYKVWFSELNGFIKDASLFIEVPNEFAKSWLKENYEDLLQRLIKEANLQGFEFVVTEKPKAEQMVIPYNPVEVIGRRISPRYTLEDFVVGRCNELAYKVCSQLVENKPKGYFIYLYGNYGLGKTHLTQAVGNGLLKQGFNRVHYFTAQDFLSCLLKYLRAGQIEAFKEKIRESCDLLLLDGIHFLSGKEYTQNELSFLLDYLLDERKTVILTSIGSPQELRDMDSSLKSRLNAGLMIRLNQPDFETRKKIIRFKARKEGYKFPSEVVDYLARNLRGDIRQIESAVIGLIARASFLKEQVCLQLAKELLTEISSEREGSQEMDLIIEGVVKFYGITKEDLFSPSRKKNLSLARQTVIYLLRHLAKKSLKDIAQMLKKEHSTVIYHLKSIEKRLNQNQAFKLQLQFLIKDLAPEIELAQAECTEENEYLEAGFEA
ncbi:chromosomal replication initiator protein DnaA [Caldimicrobium thiodismutans]|uniref:Chromosomal replication initiator protein DnaA n=1 Tax=Caldimicrobium thiodismutans TaxID=1653476 RepID=A0A0U5AXF1_9BACT|nr:chromosomal replication initiator protein DnaA [Caldimicrobium thiodismutans]BAU22409.1 chromosomal replication initiator protein DnaA [Caldimicrobium thiodismutans]